MRVSNEGPGPQGIPRPYRRTPVDPRAGQARGSAEGAAGTDRLDLSPEAQLIQRLQREASVSPEHAARLAALKQAVDSGTYRVPASLIAQRMLERGFGK